MLIKYANGVLKQLGTFIELSDFESYAFNLDMENLIWKKDHPFLVIWNSKEKYDAIVIQTTIKQKSIITKKLCQGDEVGGE